jgi:hypothetical protein
MSVTFYKSTVLQFTFTYSTADGKMRMYRGGTAAEGGTLVDTSAAFSLAAGAHWWAYYLNADNSGSAKVYVDGVLKASFTGDTQAHTSNGWDQIRWSGTAHTDSMGRYLDDIIITDDDSGSMTTPLTECYGKPLTPTGAAGNLKGVPDAVDRSNNLTLPAQQTAFVSGDAGEADIYDYSDLIERAVSSVVLVSINSEVLVTDSVLDTELRVLSGMTDTWYPKAYPPSSNVWWPQNWVLTQDPDGPTAWDTPSVNVLLVGIRFNT